MSRYRTVTDWADDYQVGDYTVQVADIVDTRTGRTYGDGAWRIVRTDTRKPAVRGKGGTVPFYGETAWSDVERLVGDLARKDWMDR
jgi:hypothetical protein